MSITYCFGILRSPFTFIAAIIGETDTAFSVFAIGATNDSVFANALAEMSTDIAAKARAFFIIYVLYTKICEKIATWFCSMCY